MLLAGLFESRITHADDDEKGTQIEALVVKLGGDPDTALFGAYPRLARGTCGTGP